MSFRPCGRRPTPIDAFWTGDSITSTKAFLAPMAGEKPAGFDAVAGRIDGNVLNARKGPEHGNCSGWAGRRR